MIMQMTTDEKFCSHKTISSKVKIKLYSSTCSVEKNLLKKRKKGYYFGGKIGRGNRYTKGFCKLYFE